MLFVQSFHAQIKAFSKENKHRIVFLLILLVEIEMTVIF